MKTVIKWLIAKFCPGYHLGKNPSKKPRAERVSKDIPSEVLQVYRKSVIGPNYATTDQEREAGLKWDGKELGKQ